MSGVEWVIEAYGCDPVALSNIDKLRDLFARLIENLSLKPVSEPLWHKFPDAGGITGLCLLAESHLACHTFPEYGSMCLNIFCCRPRPFWNPAPYLTREFGAADVQVREIERAYSEAAKRQEVTAKS